MLSKGALPTFSGGVNGKSKDWWYEIDLKALAGQMKANRMRPSMWSRSRLQVWLIRACTTILLWTCVIQLTTVKELWQPHMLRSCFDQFSPLAQQKIIATSYVSSSSKLALLPFSSSMFPDSYAVESFSSSNFWGNWVDFPEL